MKTPMIEGDRGAGATMALDNLSIRARIGMAFGVVLVLMAIMMAVALGRVSDLEARLAGAGKPAATRSGRG